MQGITFSYLNDPKDMVIQDIYQRAIRYAAQKHAERHQTLPDTILTPMMFI